MTASEGALGSFEKSSGRLPQLAAAEASVKQLERAAGELSATDLPALACF